MSGNSGQSAYGQGGIPDGFQQSYRQNRKDTETPGFFKRVYQIVACIPRGRVTSYGAIARALGDARCARQVGWAMRCCPDTLPWQRVVKADGSIVGGGYSEIRRAMLIEEGVPFLPDGCVDLSVCGYTPEPEDIGINIQ